MNPNASRSALILAALFALLATGDRGLAAADESLPGWPESFEVPAYPGASLDLWTGEVVPGVTVTTGSFETPESPDRVRDFFVQAFNERQRWTTLALDPPNRGVVVSGFDFQSRTILAAAIFEHGDGALVFPSRIAIAPEETPEGLSRSEVPSAQFPMLDGLLQRLRSQGEAP